MTSPVIDVHTHVLTDAWFELLHAHGAPRYSCLLYTSDAADE